ncbi:MAG: hypothetical protein RLZZ328_1402 [Bacteroidota bacterium]|jgi:hypothetical protein
MQIDNLEKMDQIVSNNKSLSWDGWTVVHRYASEKGRTSKYGEYFNGKWQMVRRFVPNRNGWEIPDKFVR